MRIKVLSDLHTEFHDDGGKLFVRKYLKAAEADILILAGDIANSYTVLDTIDVISKHYPETLILYVPGNHEFYGSDLGLFLPESAIYRAIEAACPNVRVMYNRAERVGKFLFVGTTMWFPPNPQSELYRFRMNDFSQIRHFSDDVYKHNKEANKFLKWHINNESIVITHHLPLHQSVPEEFKADPLNMFYMHDQHKIIMRRKPRMWVHGHTHASSNYMFHKTHVVCNPLGYVGVAVNPHFIPNMIIDTEA